MLTGEIRKERGKWQALPPLTQDLRDPELLKSGWRQASLSTHRDV
jgi:hypothetical protein